MSLKSKLCFLFVSCCLITAWFAVSVEVAESFSRAKWQVTLCLSFSWHLGRCAARRSITPGSLQCCWLLNYLGAGERSWVSIFSVAELVSWSLQFSYCPVIEIVFVGHGWTYLLFFSILLVDMLKFWLPLIVIYSMFFLYRGTEGSTTWSFSWPCFSFKKMALLDTWLLSD